MRSNPRARQIGQHVSDYQTADRFLGGKDEKKLANNTSIYRGAEGSIGVRLHGTTVVRYYPDGRVQLDSGGYRTATTKQRINQLLPGMMGLYQKRHEWFVQNRYLGTEEEFEDGMIVRLGAPMRADKEYDSNPGKFSDGMEEFLYHAAADEPQYTLGSSDELGWYGYVSGMSKSDALAFAKELDADVTGGGMVEAVKEHSGWPLNAIVMENSDGHVDVSYYDSNRDMMRQWREIEKEYDRYYAGEER